MIRSSTQHIKEIKKKYYLKPLSDESIDDIEYDYH